MPRYRCNACNGVYTTDQEGGYFHVCPPGTKDARNECLMETSALNIMDTGEVRDLRRMKAEGKGRTLITK